MLTKAPKGTKDILPAESHIWHEVEGKIRKLCELYGFREIRTPVFEHTELFLRGVGDTTDIVQKEMYTFEDKGGRSITLKPEGTAGVARAFIEHGIYNDSQPTKMYYLNAPIFRYENPQTGRLREHHQFGVEMFGAKNATADADVISIALRLFESLGITKLCVNINSIGCPACRPKYNAALYEYLAGNINNMCPICKDRFEKNPLRILDCKNEDCQKHLVNAPVMLDYLCQECHDHFEDLKMSLDALGISYSINPHIVRGLDYYTKTVFEIISDSLGAHSTVCGGGRYDKLLEQLGGPQMPGVGFGMGMERIILILQALNLDMPPKKQYKVLLVSDSHARKEALALCNDLRRLGISSDIDHCSRSIKAQFKYADRLGADYVVVIGEQELDNHIVKIRDMHRSSETTVDMRLAASHIAGILNKLDSK